MRVYACLLVAVYCKLYQAHALGVKPEGLLLECSVGYLESRQLKVKYTWQFTLCLLQIIDSRLPTGSTNFHHNAWWLRSLQVRVMHTGPYKRQKFSLKL